jgi:hypothetical protein
MRYLRRLSFFLRFRESPPRLLTKSILSPPHLRLVSQLFALPVRNCFRLRLTRFEMSRYLCFAKCFSSPGEKH